GGDELSVPAAEWRIVDPKLHRERRLIDVKWWKWNGVLCVRNAFAQADAGRTRQRDDVARPYFLGFHPIESLVGEQPGNPNRPLLTITVAEHDPLLVPERSLHDAADCERPQVIIALHIGDQHL